MPEIYYPEDTVVARKRIERLASEATLYVTMGAAICAGVFTWLTFRGIPFGEVFANSNADYLQKIILAFYYNCWVWGSLFDTRLQKEVYFTAPDKAHFRGRSILLVCMLIAVGIGLFAVRSDEFWFAVALLALVVVNVFGWSQIVSITSPIVSQSKAEYSKHNDNFSIESLEWVAYYMMGRWQKIRFALMLLFAAILLSVALSPSARGVGMLILGKIAPAGIPTATLNAHVPVAILFLYVFVAEGWIWFMRTVTKTALFTIDRLRSKYQLVSDTSHSNDS
jgi:hypothetical protein